MRQRTYLFNGIFISLVSMSLAMLTLSCHQVDDIRLTPVSTDKIAKITERYLTGEAASVAWSSDTLNAFKLNNQYYVIARASSSTFTYNSQRQLIGQMTYGYRNDTEYGRTNIYLNCTFSYTPNDLSITILKKRGTISYYNMSTTTQLIPLDEQGFTEKIPSFEGLYTVDDNGLTGISYLLEPFLKPFSKDTLRRYNSDGYLTNAIFVSGGRVVPGKLNQTITNGNVFQTNWEYSPDFMSSDSYRTLKYTYQYDLLRQNIPNPHQFLGNYSRNLPAKVTQINVFEKKQTATTVNYMYEFDSKGRVKRYIIDGVYKIVGDITYTD